jgi:hypothetical protein
VPHVRSLSYRTAVIDNAITSAIELGATSRILLSLTRLEIYTQWDNVEDVPGGGFRVVPGDIGTKEQRTIEFTADMAPDQALTVVNNVLETMSRLSADSKAKYGLPNNIAPIVPIEVKGAR